MSTYLKTHILGVMNTDIQKKIPVVMNTLTHTWGHEYTHTYRYAYLGP